MLHLGDHVQARSVLENVSDEKHTGLGIGHFVTQRIEYTTLDGELVATQLWRILKFKPGTGKGAAAREAASDAGRPLRPRPSITLDNAFWFDGAREHRLLIQRCASCGALRHPPRPRCDRCGSYEWDALEASGRGIIYSYVVNHHPQVPAFDYPLPDRADRARGGHAPRRRPRRHRAHRDRDRDAGHRRVDRARPRPHAPRVPPGTEVVAMDFTLSEEQVAVRDLAEQIFQGSVTVESVKAVEASEDRVDRELWQALAEAGLLGIALPEDAGGSGLGVVELCLMLEQQGRVVAPVPVWATVVLGALAIAEFGSPEQRSAWLPGVVAGDVFLTAALAEAGVNDVFRPQARARRGRPAAGASTG